MISKSQRRPSVQVEDHEQRQWEEVFGSGLIRTRTLMQWAGEVWDDENEDEDEDWDDD